MQKSYLGLYDYLHFPGQGERCVRSYKFRLEPNQYAVTTQLTGTSVSDPDWTRIHEAKSRVSDPDPHGSALI
jgi:hypothetical protein